MNNLYAIADNVIKILNMRAVIRFRRAKKRLLKADELNVIEICTGLYESLENDNRELFTQLVQEVYKKAYRKKGEPDWPTVLAWLEECDPVTGYVYTHEVKRKQAYAQEGIAAEKTTSGKNKAITKALRYWANMTDQYCDILTDKTVLQAYKDAGVEYVMWMTEEDEKVCKICRPLDGKIYPISQAPPKQHWHCRCWLAPVDKNGNRIKVKPA